MIVLPIAGNACEHITAVIVACKNKMNLSLGIAIGSSIQVRLETLPVEPPPAHPFTTLCVGLQWLVVQPAIVKLIRPF